MLIAVTGKVHDLTGNHIKRPAFFRLVRLLGQDASFSVGPSIHLLVRGEVRGQNTREHMSNKESAARRLGITVMGDTEFFTRFVRNNEPLTREAVGSSPVIRNTEPVWAPVGAPVSGGRDVEKEAVEEARAEEAANTPPVNVQPVTRPSRRRKVRLGRRHVKVDYT